MVDEVDGHGGPAGQDAASAQSRTTIYDVAAAAGVATSTVSRALAHPGRVSFSTAERIRQVADELGYRSTRIARPATRRTSLLAVVVADITNPVYFGMIRGAERTAAHAGYTAVVVETQESEVAERAALARVQPFVDGVVLTSSRMPDASIREVAKQGPLVVLNRMVGQVPSVTSDNVRAVKRATEHLAGAGVDAITYLPGPEASWSDGMRWRGLREAGMELGLRVRRVGCQEPTMRGGAAAAEEWLEHRTPGVIAYNDLLAIGFIRTVTAAGVAVPQEVRVVGFDNIVDAELVQPGLTTLASPLVSLGSAAVNHLLKSTDRRRPEELEPVLLPARLVVRGSTGPHAGRGTGG
ncbi:LacI family DNA-binding transcriptional regulator [Microlunatus capsulatus]|uniref:LacI family transcriptional regulator n=1 Tax=Microlunatus capsulatus TaxID=99117 RepID=A0ABS4ZDC9_9ACTN|nr:LacI family DNA-binding transcriptional regulator [Microlunatus capsulatus]MBP2419036.1 LacI family transcriptional regulator [Microlunatus capsulatus]